MKVRKISSRPKPYASSKPAWVAVDTETTGLERWQNAIAFAVTICPPDPDVEQPWYAEWTVNPENRRLVAIDPSLQLGTQKFLGLPMKEHYHQFCRDYGYIKQVCEDPDITKVFHNAKFDIHFLAKHNIKVLGKIEDTSFAARVCCNLEVSYRLKYLAKKYYGIDDDDEKRLKDYVNRIRLRARKKGWAVHPEHSEADYWLIPWAAELGLPEVDPDLVKVYCIRDGIRTAKLWTMYHALLEEDEHWRATYEHEIRGILPWCQEMEFWGMGLSRSRARQELEEARTRAEGHKKNLRHMVQNPNFNPNSNDQLLHVLYDQKRSQAYPVVYSLPVTRMTQQKKPSKTGRPPQPSTDWKALRPYQEHPFVRELQLFKSADKSIETFYQKYLDMAVPDPEYRDPDFAVIHPSLNQCGTGTGRWSCNDPNLQQAANPESSPRGTDIHARAPFRPRPGYSWYCADYSQMELRVFADVAQVDGMLKAIWSGVDLNNSNTNLAWGGKGNPHALEAAAHALELGHDIPTRQEIQDVWDRYEWCQEKARRGMRSDAALDLADRWLAEFGYDIVTAEKSIIKSQSRQRGKTVMFVKMYGGGASAVTDLLFCSLDDAQRFLAQFDEPFPEINRYQKRAIATARRDGYIITKYGRKLMVEPDHLYRAVNYMVQGTCADLMKHSIRRCGEYLRETGIDAHMVMTIHDELIFEVRNEHAYKQVLWELCRIMGDSEGRIGVPMPVEMKRCRTSWQEKEKVILPKLPVPDPPKDLQLSLAIQ